MNAPNINNNNAGDLVGRTRDIDSRLRSDKSQSAGSAETVAGAGDAARPETPVTPVQDSYQATRDREFARELAGRIENDEAPVRDDAVQRARQRVADGYYDSREFLGNLASKLINTNRAM